MIIAFTGYAGAGKDECAKLVQRIVPGGVPFRHFKFSSKLRAEMIEILEHPYLKTKYRNFKLRFCLNKISPSDVWKKPTPFWCRKALQYYGDYCRELMEDYFIPNNYEPWEKLVISDLRFKNEFNWVKKNNGFVVRVENPRVKTSWWNKLIYSHKSEKQQEFLTPDYVIVNNGSLQDLEEKVERVFDEIISRSNKIT